LKEYVTTIFRDEEETAWKQVAFLLSLFFDPKDGGDMLFQNV
jgi:hypothetical protein